MRIRREGLVQLTTGDAVKGVLSRLGWPWRYIRVDSAVAYAIADAGVGPTKVDGIVWIPKLKVAFIQELTHNPVVNIEVPVNVKSPVTVVSPGGSILDES